MIRYRARGLWVVEGWFTAPADTAGADIIRTIQTPEPLSAQCTPFQTPHLDLRESESKLFSGMKKDTRRDIRKAGGDDGLSTALTVLPSPAWKEYALEYDQFSRSRGLSPILKPRLRALAEAGLLMISRCRDLSQDLLTTHTYVVTPGRARLLHSFSSSDLIDRRLIGRANRFHHWQDILAFQARGLAIYDLGGWHGRDSDSARAGIDRFKEEFGGTIVQEYNCDRAVSLGGRLYVRLSRWRQAARQSK